MNYDSISDFKLYRYIDLSQLLSLLLNRSLFFPSIKCLPDKNEFADHGLIATVISKLNNCDDDETEKIKRNINQIRGKIFVSCWSLSSDDYALWRIYTNNSKFGFMIESSKDKVLDSLSSREYRIFHKAIKYEPYALTNYFKTGSLTPESSIDDLIDFFPFIKIPNYKYENEYRFLIYDDKHENENGLSINCDPSKLIYSLHFSPFMPLWFKNDMNNLKNKLMEGDPITIYKAFEPLIQLVKSVDSTKIYEM